MALPLAKTVQAPCMVYDCMDELSAFEGAARQLRQRESALMKQAHLVLAGGPSLYATRRDLHANIHCFPSAVDVAHFAPGGLRTSNPNHLASRSLQARLPHPRAGYFGVIDERLDLELVAMLADAHPDWSVIMAGPVVKIDPAKLPRRENLHWLGMQPYARLPYLLTGWDVCLMPFAINASTQFISPTKTLEYMAGEKPVVSTAIPDVISLYGDVVAVAYSRGDFVRACEQLMDEAPAARARRAIEMLQIVSVHSWDRSAESVETLLQAALAQARAGTAMETAPAIPADAEWAFAVRKESAIRVAGA
jgi:glycosyltransferase involved in cell wall biosynthesis